MNVIIDGKPTSGGGGGGGGGGGEPSDKLVIKDADGKSWEIMVGTDGGMYVVGPDPSGD